MLTPHCRIHSDSGVQTRHLFSAATLPKSFRRRTSQAFAIISSNVRDAGDFLRHGGECCDKKALVLIRERAT